MTEKDFLDNGFQSDDDPFFKWSKQLVEPSEMERCELDFDENPTLLFGSTGLNAGFCLYTGAHFIWLNSATIEDAVALAEKVISIEPV